MIVRRAERERVPLRPMPARGRSIHREIVAEGGRRRAPVEIAGELSPVDRERVRWLLAQPYRRIASLRLTEAELRAYVTARGVKPGWVWHRLHERLAAS